LFRRKVPPAELEALIHQHPSVEDVGVFGLPDSDAGELPRAWVVVKPGYKLTEKSIVDWVASKSYIVICWLSDYILQCSLCSVIDRNLKLGIKI